MEECSSSERMGGCQNQSSDGELIDVALKAAEEARKPSTRKIQNKWWRVFLDFAEEKKWNLEKLTYVNLLVWIGFVVQILEKGSQLPQIMSFISENLKMRGYRDLTRLFIVI